MKKLILLVIASAMSGSVFASPGDTNVSRDSEPRFNEADSAIPRWTALKTYCFDTELSRQGLAASQGDVLFTHTRLNGVAVRALDLLEPAASYAIEDESIIRP